MSKLEYLHGRLSYRRKSSGAERGREDFWLTRNRDGSRSLRSIAMTDDSRFVRDVLYTLGADLRPAEAFIRLMVGDTHSGSGYFRTDGERLRIACDGRDTGHTEQIVAVPRRFHISTHSVMLDGWPFWAYDPAGPQQQELVVYNTSTRWNGTDGPLGRLETLDVTSLGEEDVSVPAGRFRCRHYAFDTKHVKDVPTSHVYVTGEHSLLVRYDWDAFDLEYVLERLTREEPRD